MRALQHASLGDDRGGVVLENAPALVGGRRVVIDEADDGGERCRGRGDARDRAFVGGEKSRVLDQIADAVPRDHHLGGYEQVGSARRRFGDRGEHLGGVSFDVAARRVELGQGDAHEADAACYPERRSATATTIFGAPLAQWA